MLERFRKYFDRLRPFDRMILALAYLCLVVIFDYNTGQLPVLILYVLCVAWSSNYIGGKFSLAYALVAAYFRVKSPEYEEQGFEALLYVNIAATFLFFDTAIQFKNRLLGQLNQSLAQVELLSLTDSLTGIANRRAFLIKLEQTLAQAHRYHEPFSLAYVDIDNFKMVNDSVSHAAGDDLLCCIAQTIRLELRGADMAARLGGDEFGMIFTHAKDNPSRYVKRVKQALDDQCANAPTYKGISFSIGVVEYDGTAPARPEELIQCADSLMYEIKKSGKNGVRFGTFPIRQLGKI